MPEDVHRIDKNASGLRFSLLGSHSGDTEQVIQKKKILEGMKKFAFFRSLLNDSVETPPSKRGDGTEGGQAHVHGPAGAFICQAKTYLLLKRLLNWSLTNC